MDEELTIKLPRSEYMALSEIAITAEQWLRTGDPQLVEELRDSLLTSKALADDDRESEVKIVLPQSVADWLDAEMINVIENSGMGDSSMAREVRRALQDTD